MSNILPRVLTTDELIRYCYQLIVSGGMPLNYQEELLKRYEALAYESN
jgi:hypothetical protein